MIEILKSIIEKYESREQKIHHFRESLQILILKIIYDCGFFRDLSFVGGTALRILYDLRRFSEDLDFSLTQKKVFDFTEFSQSLQRRLRQYGLIVEVKEKTEANVKNLIIRFPEILYSLGLSPLKGQKTLIKVEVDINPPSGWRNEISLVNKIWLFSVTHFDLASLFATKIHACFFRKYVKGRDFYDLIWYFSKKVIPNFELLNNGIIQTEGKNLNLGKENFKDFLREQIEKIDFSLVRRDVERFLVDKNEVKLLKKELILKSGTYLWQ